MSKSSRNSGIMAGFEDEMEEEDVKPMARSPQNPEILMNNLRGDIRSVDARYLELAQMVGEEAAMETPPEVLAMLQSQLAAQAAAPMPQGGIGALPQGAEMAPPPMMGQGMPPGMEGMPPFPQGGAEQAPPTPDGMPPLRAAEGAFATQDARREQMNSPLYMPSLSRMNELTSGNVPEEQMTPQEREFLRSYKFGMGFTGGTIRDVAREGFGRIGSALSPYVQRGLSYADELAGRYFPGTFKAAPLTEGGRRAVVQGRESILQGADGPVMGTGTRLTAANTLGFGQRPFSEIVDPAVRKLVEFSKKKVNPGVAAATTLAAMGVARRDLPPPRSAEELAQVNALINQIPGPNTPLRDGRPAVRPEQVDPNAPAPAPAPAPDMAPPYEVIDEVAEDGQPTASSLLQRLVGDKQQFTYDPRIAGGGEGSLRDDVTRTIRENIRKPEKEQVFKTRGERIRAEYEETEPLFRELLGDTKADARTNALLLLADAGFKFASTYKPTMAMALGEALSGVPKGFANIVAQAKDRNIRIKTAALQEATNSINMQDKVARDFQLEAYRQSGRLAYAGMTAEGRERLEGIKGEQSRRTELLKQTWEQQKLQWERDNPIVKDLGFGMGQSFKKDGSPKGEPFMMLGPNGEAPGVVKEMMGSEFTLSETDSPYVTNLGTPPAATVRTEAGRAELGKKEAALTNALKEIRNVEGEVQNLFTPQTWFVNKVDNILVPVSGGTLKPNLDKVKAKAALTATLNRLMKNVASSDQAGRTSVQEQEWARQITEALNDPVAFFSDPATAAKVLATIKTGLINERQGVLTQLGFIDKELVKKVPATGTENDPFMYGNSPEEAKRMDLYLKSSLRGMSPNSIIYLNRNGQTYSATVGNVLSAK
jgi:hypothetical protein